MNDVETSDRELVTRFAVERDEEAFALLVRRHCGLVLGVCRRVLGDTHDAEDAFQATFLVLAKDAGRIRRRASVASWLYGVAYRTSMRALTARGRRREEPLAEDTPVADETLEQLTARHEQQTLDEELNALPDRYRDPLVLHYLQGKSNKEIAAELDLSVSAVEGRLKRGKKELRLRLARRGVGLSIALAAVHASTASAEAASETLITATVEAGVAFAAEGPVSGSISSEAASLAEKELAVMSLPTLPTLSLMVLLVVTAGFLGNSPGSGADTQQASVPNLMAGVVSPTGDAAAEPLLRLAQAKKKTVEAKPAAAQPPVLSLKRRTPTEEKIFAALDEQTNWQFTETPLTEVALFLHDLHGVRIMLDRRSLEDAGKVPDDTLITYAVSDVSLRNALRLALEQHGLDYIVRNEVMMITTEETASTTLDLRVYQLGHLRHIEPEMMVETIKRMIHPDSWQDQGGPGDIEALPGCLVISQTQRAHEEIVELFEQLGHVTP